MTNSCKNSKTYLRGNSIFWINILHQQIFLKSMSYIKIYLASITCNTQAPISSSRASKPPTWRGEREVSFCISLNSKCHLIYHNLKNIGMAPDIGILCIMLSKYVNADWISISSTLFPTFVSPTVHHCICDFFVFVFVSVWNLYLTSTPIVFNVSV